MSTATPRAKSFPSHVDQTDRYIRETCAELDGAFDREALQLLCRVGVFAVDDPSEIDRAVARLRGHNPTAETETECRLEAQAVDGETPDLRGDAVMQLTELTLTRLTDSVEAAYLLGIAVGRRLGPAALRLDAPAGAPARRELQLSPGSLVKIGKRTYKLARGADRRGATLTTSVSSRTRRGRKAGA